jgi:hypothetical protein
MDPLRSIGRFAYNGEEFSQFFGSAVVQYLRGIDR